MAEEYSKYINKLSATAKALLFEKEFEDEWRAQYRRSDGRIIEFVGERYIPDLVSISLKYPNRDEDFSLGILMDIFYSISPDSTQNQAGEHFDHELKFLSENIDGWLSDPANFQDKYASIADVILDSVEEIERRIGKRWGEDFE